MSVVQPVGHWRLSQQLPETGNETTYRHKKEYTSIKTTITNKERLLRNVYTLEKKTNREQFVIIYSIRKKKEDLHRHKNDLMIIIVKKSILIIMERPYWFCFVLFKVIERIAERTEKSWNHLII